MPAWLRYTVLASVGLLAIAALLFPDCTEKGEVDCPSSWSTCERSFVYVTGVRPDYQDATDEFKVDRCYVVARLPLGKIDDKPRGPDDHVLRDARRIDLREADRYRACETWLHTWQPVVYDAQNPRHVRFMSLHQAGPDLLQKLLIVFVIAVMLGYPLWSRFGGRNSGSARLRFADAWNQRRKARKQRKQDRAKRKREAFYAEIRAESAKIDASVAADAAATRDRDPAD